MPKARGQELMDKLYGLTLGRLRTREAKLREQGQNQSADAVAQLIEDVLQLEGENARPNTPVYDPEKGESQSIAYDLHVAAKEFAADWDNIRAQIERENDVWEQVKSKVPTSAGVMRHKFHLDVVPVELAGDIQGSQTLTQDDLAEHNSIVQEACRRRVEEAIEEMIASPRQQLADALANRFARQSQRSACSTSWQTPTCWNR